MAGGAVGPRQDGLTEEGGPGLRRGDGAPSGDMSRRKLGQKREGRVEIGKRNDFGIKKRLEIQMSSK